VPILSGKNDVVAAGQCLHLNGAAQLEGWRQPIPRQKEQSMELGAFSVSLAVKDIEDSRGFYAKLGFKVFAGDASQNWLILRNGDYVIGILRGMFEKSILTFNPGWNSALKSSPLSPMSAKCSAN